MPESSSIPSPSASPPPTAVVACAVFEAEVRAFATGLSHLVSLTFLPQSLHNEPATLNVALRQTVAAIEADTQAEVIVLVYGVCSRGIERIPLRRCRMIVPRAHDCITLLLGSKERYRHYQKTNPAIYWYSPGWNARDAVPGPRRHQRLQAEYTAKFDEDEAAYLLAMEKELHAPYTTAAYVDLGIGDAATNIAYTQQCACWMGWDFERVSGDPRLLLDLLSGAWDDERFLSVQPRQWIQLSLDDRVIESIPASSAS